jgi:hypothetical protein
LTSVRNVLNFKKCNVVSKGFLTLRYVNFTIDQIARKVKIYTGRKTVARAGVFFLIPFLLGAPSITSMVILCFLVRASLYIPISRPTDATCDRFLFSIYLVRNWLLVVHLSETDKTVPQTDTNTETGGCMYGEGLLMMSA